MKRAVVLLVLLAALPAARAAGKPDDPIRLAVSPADAPKPSLKYVLSPARRDLVTGKPFEYSVNDGVAILSTPPIPGVKGTATSAVKYELTLRK